VPDPVLALHVSVGSVSAGEPAPVHEKPYTGGGLLLQLTLASAEQPANV
jgi:hypothetical protein